jgi:Rrf2 family transcriptional regulator, cysteine metabolism repressor
MLLMPTRAKYGLAALLELANKGETDPVQTRVLAEKCNIPHNFLEQVLLTLKKADIVKSFRGSNGGYVLNKNIEDITVFDIVKVLEGEKSMCDGYCGCKTLEGFWAKIDKDIKLALKVSVKVLLENKQKQEKMLDYQI